MSKKKAPKTPPTQSVKAYQTPRETTAWVCPICRRLTKHEGRITEKGCRVCDKAVTQDVTDPFASHPTPHGAKRDL